MDTKFDFGDESAARIVYVRPVDVAELPAAVQDQAQGARIIYALHGADGARLALVRDRRLAFMLARENNLSAVSVH